MAEIKSSADRSRRWRERHRATTVVVTGDVFDDLQRVAADDETRSETIRRLLDDHAETMIALSRV